MSSDATPDRHPDADGVTRRAMLAGVAAAAAATLAPSTARAQPTSRRVKGPAVFLDYDLETLASPYGLLGRAALEQMKLV